MLAWKNLGDKRRRASGRAPAHRGRRARRSGPKTAPRSIVGVAEWPKKLEVKKSDEDPATVEVWHWQDVNVISEQKLTAARDRDRNAPAAWHIASGKLVPLSTNLKEDVRLPRTGIARPGAGRHAVQNDAMFGRSFADVYKIDLETGARAEVAKHLIPPVEFSPGGRYAMNFKEGDFWVYDLETGSQPQHHQGRQDRPSPTKRTTIPCSQKPAYGVAGWTKDDRSVIVYDTNDLWEIFPDGSAKPKRLTDGAAEEIRYRYVRVSAGGGGGGRGGRGGGGGDGADRSGQAGLPQPGRPLDQEDRLRRACEDGKVDRLVYQDKAVRGLEKAKDADVLLYQAGAWDRIAELLSRGNDLKSSRAKSATPTPSPRNTPGARPSWSTTRTPTATGCRARSTIPRITRRASSTP